MDTKLLGSRIKTRRMELGISAAKIAEATGLNKATIHRYENGDFKKVKLPTIESIANILDVSPAWLIGKSDEKFLPESQLISPNEITEIINLTLMKLEEPNLVLDGKPVTLECKHTLSNAIQVGLELARKLNNPKK